MFYWACIVIYPCSMNQQDGLFTFNLFQYEGVLISPWPDQEGNKLQRSNSGFIQNTRHEAQYTSYPVALTFASHSKKKIQKVVRPTRSPRQQWPPRRTKNGDLSIVFQSREQVVVRWGQIRRIGWVIKTLEAQVGQFLLDCKCPVSRGIVVQEPDPLGDLPAAFSLQNVLQLHQQRWVIFRVGRLEDNQWGGCRLDPKKSRRELFQRIFALGIFFGGAGWATMPPLHWLWLCLRVIVI